jgi:hypothetical protein
MYNLIDFAEFNKKQYEESLKKSDPTKYALLQRLKKGGKANRNTIRTILGRGDKLKSNILMGFDSLDRFEQIKRDDTRLGLSRKTQNNTSKIRQIENKLNKSTINNATNSLLPKPKKQPKYNLEQQTVDVVSSPVIEVPQKPSVVETSKPKKTTPKSPPSSPNPRVINTQPVEDFPKTTTTVTPPTNVTTKKGFKINPKYALGALGAGAVIGAGYLGYKAYQNNKGKKQ